MYGAPPGQPLPLQPVSYTHLEKADAAGILRQDRGHLRRLGFELQGHIILGQSGSGHQIAEGIFRSGALSGEVYGCLLYTSRCV